MLVKVPGLHSQYRLAKDSIIRSIFCASPGSWKLPRKALHWRSQGYWHRTHTWLVTQYLSAATRSSPWNLWWWTNWCNTSILNCFLPRRELLKQGADKINDLIPYPPPKYSPIAPLSNWLTKRKSATSSGVQFSKWFSFRNRIPYSIAWVTQMPTHTLQSKWVPFQNRDFMMPSGMLN